MGLTFPNPNVAAVLYDKDGNFIAGGFHNRRESRDHAEVVAINQAGAAARGGTIVVSLEPCAHTGSTPPCAQAIIDAGIAKVIYAVSDPNPLAAGGADKLIAAGLIVEHHPAPTLEFLQRAWLHKVRTGRALMIWKVAITLDGKVTAIDGSSQWISGEESRADVQRIRSQSDAILVGTNTALIDNPHLIPRGFTHRPTRIIFGEQEIPLSHKVFDDEARTLLVKSKSITELLQLVKTEGFNQVLVEAGPTLGSALLQAGAIDEIIIYQAPKLFGSGKSFVADLGISTISEHIPLNLISVEKIGNDIKSHYEVKGR